MSPNGDIAFVRKLEKLIAENGTKTLRMISDEEELDAQDLKYVTSFFLSGCVGMIDIWLQNNCKQTAQHMATLAMNLLRAGVQALPNNNCNNLCNLLSFHAVFSSIFFKICIAFYQKLCYN